MIGQTLSHYRILEKLGEGGMGEVYRAEDPELERQVALKVLPDEFGRDPERLSRFRREAKSLAALDHPGIVTIYSVEEAEGKHFLTMGLVEGQPLDQVIPSGGLELEKFFSLAIPLAEAVAAAHERGITHRDLKPANVMVTPAGRVKVLDFGLAKRLAGGLEGSDTLATAGLTRDGQIVGTVAYMSPEQAEGRAVDPRSDIFSLGIVLYEMAVGSSPFRGDNNLATLTSILRDEPAAVTEIRPNLPTHLARIIRRCLEKEPSRRYQTALDVYNELRDLSDQVSGVAAPGAGSRATKAAPYRRLLALAGIVAVLLVASYLVVKRPLGERTPETAQGTAVSSVSTIAIVPFTVRGSPEFDYLGEGVVDLLSTKLDGAGELRSVDPNAVLSYVSQNFEGRLDPSAGRRLAEHFRARLYVVGEIVEVAGALHVTASLYERDAAAALSKASVEGPAEELFGLIDELAAELVTEQVSGPGAEFTRIAAVTTESLPALKAYLQGESELRRGQFTAALETFQKTLELDPEFALAWYRLSVASEWAIRNDLVETAASEAVRLSSRLSDHYRRLLEARLEGRQGDPLEAERLYRDILGTHPDDVEAWTQLAEVLSHYSHVTGRSLSEGRQAWERVRELEPDLVLALWHLVRIAALERDEEELSGLVDRLLELAPEAERVLEIQALEAFTVGDAAEQQEVVERFADVNDGVLALVAWSLSITMDTVEGTSAVARALIEPQRSSAAQGLGHSVLAYTAVAEGRWQDARQHLRAAAAVTPHLGLGHRALLSAVEVLPVSRQTLGAIRDELLAWDATRVPPSGLQSFFYSSTDGLHPHIRLYLLGLLSARLGDRSALDHAAALTAASESSPRPPIVRNLAAGVRAAWWRAQGDPRRELAELDSFETGGISYQDVFASPFFSQPYERLRRGMLARELGDPQAARRWLSSLAEVSFYDDALVPLSHLHRGELFEQQGDPDAAALHYRRFLELWSTADDELRPWLERAEAGLQRLGVEAIAPL